MSTQPLEQAVTATRAVLAGVGADQLDGPTPCSSWTVRELIDHIVGGQRFFASGITGAAPSDEKVSDDFVADFDAASTECLAAFGADGALEKMYDLPFGTMPGAAFMGMASTDTFVHGWDLAKATGQSTDLDPALAAALLEQSKAAIQDAFRGPEGAPFGPEAEAPADATAADRLAAFLGRTV
ncbi:TIGR03086 family metal-binding protein [Actinospongicola halichondriae]|uniref:TIGR03086 family metal-binding protein n=1 Tax=Actinospongicola halichondriae TaxID=3236844 RepID=UPI003D5CC84F